MNANQSRDKNSCSGYFPLIITHDQGIFSVHSKKFNNKQEQHRLFVMCNSRKVIYRVFGKFSA